MPRVPHGAGREAVRQPQPPSSSLSSAGVLGLFTVIPPEPPLGFGLGFGLGLGFGPPVSPPVPEGGASTPSPTHCALPRSQTGVGSSQSSSLRQQPSAASLLHSLSAQVSAVQASPSKQSPSSWQQSAMAS